MERRGHQVTEDKMDFQEILVLWDLKENEANLVK